MSRVMRRVPRERERQPQWAKNFFQAEMMYDQNEILASMPYLKKTPEVAKFVREAFDKLGPFAPPVTLLYTTKHYWSFSWDNEAEQTMFMLKWV